MQLSSILSRSPLYSGASDRWFSEEGFIDRKLNLRVTPGDGYVSASIGRTGEKVFALSDYLVAIVSEARSFGLDRLLVHNRTGSPFEQKDFPFALSRTPSSVKFRRIAVVEPFDPHLDWTRLDIAFGRLFNVSVRRFSDAFDAVGWLSRD